MKANNNNIKRLAENLKKNPGDSFTKFALALELIKRNEVSKAGVLFESVLEQDPEYLGVYYHLGKLYEEAGRLRDAHNMFTNGIEIAKKQDNKRTVTELKEALEILTFEMDNE